MPQNTGAAWGGTKHVAPHPQFLGYSNQRVSGEGKLNGRPFQAGRGVTQGGPLLEKLFNILANAVACEWMRLMQETLDFGDMGEEE